MEPSMAPQTPNSVLPNPNLAVNPSQAMGSYEPQAAEQMSEPAHAEPDHETEEKYRWIIDPVTGGVDMILCHLQPLEYELLCLTQYFNMELSVGPFKGYGTFPFLRNLFEDKEVKELFYQGGSNSPIPALQELQQLAFSRLPTISPQEEDASAMGQQIAADGEATNDRKMGFLPQNVVEMLIEVQGEPIFNPETGLLAFGGKAGKVVNEVVRGVGTVAGFVLGGPIGAGLGHMAGRVLTGQNPKDALLPSAKTGALVWGAQQLGNWAMGRGADAAAAGTAAASNAAPAAANAAAPAAQKAAESSGLLGQVGKAFGSFGGSGGSSSAMEGLGKIGPLAAVLGLSYMGSKDTDKKNEALRQKMRQEEWAERDRVRAEGNWNNVPPPPKRRATSGEGNSPYFEYKKGGKVKSPKTVHQAELKGVAIRGPGKGQADVINTALRAGDFIIPADVASAWGDGSSKAGTRQIEILVKKYSKGKSVKAPRTSKVPVALSDSEARIPNRVVTALGKGNHAKGVKKLEKAMINTRKHQQSNGTGLPPKSYPIEHYMK